MAIVANNIGQYRRQSTTKTFQFILLQLQKFTVPSRKIAAFG